jgi:O-antigen/teichoic acid export membrane protein
LGQRYAASAQAMRLLSIGAFMLFVASPFPLLITALNRQRFVFISSSTSSLIRVALDLVLVPYFGFLAPCISLAVSETALLAMWIGCLWQMGFPAPLSRLMWRPCVAGALIVPFLYTVQPRSMLFLTPEVLSAITGYMIVLIMLGAFPPTEMTLIREGIAFVRPFVNSVSGQSTEKAS